MSAPRNFRLACTDSVLMPPTFGRGTALRVIAGEACTELGCDVLSEPSMSWLRRWMQLSKSRTRRPRERKDHGIEP